MSKENEIKTKAMEQEQWLQLKMLWGNLCSWGGEGGGMSKFSTVGGIPPHLTLGETLQSLIHKRFKYFFSIFDNRVIG